MKIRNIKDFKKSQLQDYINKQKKKGELNSDDLQLQKVLKKLFQLQHEHG